MRKIQVTVKKQHKIKDKGFMLRTCVLNKEKCPDIMIKSG
jgi:hypothetical protein